MKVLSSADMEGTCGVTSWVQVMPPEYGGEPSSTVEYERARLRLTREVNAAVEGALAAGAEEVIVNESHDGMRNLIAEELHPRVRFITGNDKPLGMVQGIAEEGVGALFYTGYHAKAGTPNAPATSRRGRTPRPSSPHVTEPAAAQATRAREETSDTSASPLR